MLAIVHKAAAQEDIFLEVVVPGSRVEATTEGVVKTVVTGIAEYVDIIFTFSISVVGLVAGVMIMIGGYQYLTSAGDAARAKQAKERIGNAVIGMVLALFSFVLLNQINPDLVKLKSVESLVESVKTELSLLPWCEDILNDGQLVTAVSKAKDCGDIGEYTPKEGGSEKQFCLYHGGSLFGSFLNAKTGKDKRPDTGLRHSTVCFQGNRGGPEMVEIVKQLKEGKKLNKSKVALATELSCLGISGEQDDAGKLRALGFSGPTPELCERWTSIARSVYEKEPKPKQVAYCGWSSDRNRCVEVTINCEAANDNWEDEPSSCVSYNAGSSSLKKTDQFQEYKKQCDAAKAKGAQCQGYDESPEPMWRCHPSKDSSKYDKDGFKICHFNTLERTETHLASVCILNPCKFNLENGGCKGAGVSVHVYPPSVGVSTTDCRNR